jgi:two-component system, NarL family, nitrate/nitrite response regulator NarL
LTASPARIRLVVADPHPLYLLGACDTIRDTPDFELLEAVADGAMALRAIQRHRPAVALLGTGLEGLSVERVLNAITRDRLKVAVIILGHDDAGAFDGFRLGAAGYLLRTATRRAVHDAIRRVARGTAVVTPEVLTGVVREIRVHNKPERTILTEREQQVLALMAQGKGNQAIADELFLSLSTIRTHIEHIRDKLDARDRAMAVAEGMRRGIIE